MGRDDFSKQTVETLAKRVNNHCSNPGCRRPTSGPNTDPDKATNMGLLMSRRLHPEALGLIQSKLRRIEAASRMESGCAKNAPS